jgi:hypothetical protein
MSLVRTTTVEVTFPAVMLAASVENPRASLADGAAGSAERVRTHKALFGSQISS